MKKTMVRCDAWGNCSVRGSHGIISLQEPSKNTERCPHYPEHRRNDYCVKKFCEGIGHSTQCLDQDKVPA